MSKTVKQQSETALEWIEGLGLKEYKQTKEELGSLSGGFCCLGLGSFLCGRTWEEGQDLPPNMEFFAEEVGLSTKDGDVNEELGETKEQALEEWLEEEACHEINCGLNLYELNDDTALGFPGIQLLLKKFPEFYFTPEVAKGIHDVYDNLV